MTRVLSLTCLVLCLIGLGPAYARPAIAILGLEVIDPSGTPTAQDTQVAKELSDGLRARAKAGTGQYQLAPGSDKELIDQKLLNNCDNEAPACMTAIGNQLGAKVLMYGKLQKEGKVYQVTLRVLDVNNSKVMKSSTDAIPVPESSGAALQGWAKKIYAKLTGEQAAAGGTIVVKLSNADRGTILINGEEKGNITAGTGTVSGLAEGKYKLAVESDGFRRWDREVTVNSGQTATIPVELERGGGGPDIGPGPGIGTGPGPGPGPGGPGPEGGRGSGAWKGVFIGSMVVAAGGGALWYLNYKKLGEQEDIIAANNGYDDSIPKSAPEREAINKANSEGDRASKMTYVGGVVMGVGLAVSAFAFYKGFIAKSSSSTEKNAVRGKRQRRERFIVTPVISPDGGGATMRLDW